MMVEEEYNQETAVQIQVFFCFLSNESGTIYTDIACKFKYPNSMALACFIILLCTLMKCLGNENFPQHFDCKVPLQLGHKF